MVSTSPAASPPDSTPHPARSGPWDGSPAGATLPARLIESPHTPDHYGSEHRNGASTASFTSLTLPAPARQRRPEDPPPGAVRRAAACRARSTRRLLTGETSRQAACLELPEPSIQASTSKTRSALTASYADQRERAVVAAVCGARESRLLAAQHEAVTIARPRPPRTVASITESKIGMTQGRFLADRLAHGSRAEVGNRKQRTPELPGRPEVGFGNGPLER